MPIAEQIIITLSSIIPNNQSEITKFGLTTLLLHHETNEHYKNLYILDEKKGNKPMFFDLLRVKYIAKN